MHPQGVAAFPHYYVGINSLTELATKDDRVCVLNITGGESRTVTPVSHVYSGGNIVCGTAPGRSGSKMKTAAGDIPVYDNVAEAVDDGQEFNVVVVYLPPSGVRDGVLEAVRVNPNLTKIVVLTEKVPVRDARIIRAIGQMHGIDIFGGNCLGLADAHNHVRIGGALGGSAPEESLLPGSVAIYSNSGNFTTTIAVYLATAGWGTTVSFSSGKDVYIHYAAQEWTHAFHNDDRSKSAVMYIEPGGYYERDLEFDKPVVACIVGRWKAKLTKACGHAGAIAGAGDNALAKEKWFMEKFGVDAIFTPENPVCSEKGAVVVNIAHIPDAMTAVMAKQGAKPDFDSVGDLSLKCWFSNSQGINLPDYLNPPVVEAMSPYGEQIAGLGEQVGTVFPRQAMKDASGASMMDPKTQVTKIHGTSVLDASTHSFEENLVQSLIREYPDENGTALANVALNTFVNQSGKVGLAAADASREAGNSPNTALSAAVAMVGPKQVEQAHTVTTALVELFKKSGLEDAADVGFDFSAQLEAADARLFLTDYSGRCNVAMLAAIEARGAKSVFIDFLKALEQKGGGKLSCSVLVAAITTHLAWKALMRKRLSVTTVSNLPWHFRVFSTLIGSAASAENQERHTFCGVANKEFMSSWSFTETAHLALLGNRPNEEALYAFSVLLGLIITNGPGTISAQGAKGAVSADGPEVPERIQVNKGYIGFLTHTGYAHGGNGFEAIAFLLDRFRDSSLSGPGDAGHGMDLAAMATDYAKEYKAYKTKAKAEGNLSYAKIPCVNHPVFKGEDVNYDPREVFVNELFKKRGSYNIFHEFYHELVNALFKTGVSRNVYCVNVDAVIAVILLKMLWQPYADGEISDSTMESAAFTTFLFGRMIGSAAEIDDHTNRGRNMDTRTAASRCSYVS
ncbi:MAG: CoA-binding protein [endosymbiont of Seepiophila jonesi]|uniref:CoA-binding protein n=3 Tax=Bacteria TaxID=2 RepID=A0A370DU99_9GAMM|nr:MAG: CoA-binding protein [endosymbiont of Lamellibrachia luymesi]RDH93625.1 MAG: CoA-binding protein [endosymbiont of Seepiophila jonesi]